jgi:hypothetical protein
MMVILPVIITSVKFYPIHFARVSMKKGQREKRSLCPVNRGGEEPPSHRARGGKPAVSGFFGLFFQKI